MKQSEFDDFLYVKESAIHGKGLFARNEIKEGQVLGYVNGKPTHIDGPYVLWIDDSTRGFEVECDFKYINHNDSPNACYYDDLTVVALRDIAKDEEITHHYGEDWDEGRDDDGSESWEDEEVLAQLESEESGELESMAS